MTTSNLKIVNRADSESEMTLRERIDSVIGERRARTLEAVERALAYHASIGVREIFLEEIPGIHHADAEFVKTWLEENGFGVRKLRMSGRHSVEIG